MIQVYCAKLGVNDPDKAYDYIKKLTGIELNFDKLTKSDATTIITKLLEKIAAKKNGRRT